MKKILFVVYLLLSTVRLIGQTCPIVTTTSGSVSCTTPCTTISATADPIRATNTYSIASTTYSPFSFTSGTNVSTASDDIFTTGITLPFCFEFFGNTYNTVYIGSNGNISFNSAVSGGYDPWSIPAGGIPSTTSVDAHRNCIMGVWCDMYPPSGGTIKYATYGSYPCRTFVVSYYNIPIFGSCSGTKDTTQIAIYETTNIIDIYICSHNIPLCTSWNSGRAVTGIENASGSLSYTVTGQNGVAFSASHQGWRFTPTGTPYVWTYTWSNSSGVIGVGSSQTVCPTSTTTYSVVASTTTSCGAVNLPSATSTVTSIVTTVMVGGDSVICQNGTTNLTGSLSGGSWYTSNPSVATVNSLGLVSGVSAGTCIITYTIAAGCQGFKTIKVNPTYNISFFDYVCDGDSYLFGGNSYNTTGTYTHTFTTINGCDSVVTLNLDVKPIPTATIENKKDNCINELINIWLSNTSSDIISYVWNFNPATILSTLGPVGPYIISYSTVGTYPITLDISNSYCRDTIVDSVIIWDYPTAKIKVLSDISNLCNGDEVHLQGTEMGLIYQWTPTEAFNGLIIADEPIANVRDSICLIMDAMNKACRTRDSICLNSQPCCIMSLPSAFTPNDDGSNDIFRILNKHIKLQDFRIQNRWGETVFQTSNIDNGWDGNYKGVKQDIGVYYYNVLYECDGKIKSEKGDCTLIR